MRTVLNRFLLGSFILVLTWTPMTGSLLQQELLTGIVVVYLSRLHIPDDLLLKLSHLLVAFLRPSADRIFASREGLFCRQLLALRNER